ncbi:unnamed protein product [Lactuca saligna]|uniref:Uncharacterized protein n=1 Tax=Lactuca saligna TaxID=75948 RepID=A0AA35YQV5_LACSI|nr:unnamed protein product [Lactuca saligna]
MDEDLLRIFSNKNPYSNTIQNPVVRSHVPKKLTFENSEFPSFNLQITQLMNDAETGDNSEGNDEDGELERNEEHILDEKGKKGQNVNEMYFTKFLDNNWRDKVSLFKSMKQKKMKMA